VAADQKNDFAGSGSGRRQEAKYMQITVNGEKRTYADSLTLVGLLEVLGVNPKSVVVERNIQIVDRSRVESEIIQDGDSIEIIRFVGGR
jgi:thiamine biosynthesis protein ThiS